MAVQVFNNVVVVLIEGTLPQPVQLTFLPKDAPTFAQALREAANAIEKQVKR